MLWKILFCHLSNYQPSPHFKKCTTDNYAKGILPLDPQWGYHLNMEKCWTLRNGFLTWWKPYGSQEKRMQCRRPRFNPQVRKNPCRRKWQPAPVFLPGEYHRPKPGELKSMRLHTVGHDWVTNTFTCQKRMNTEINTHYYSLVRSLQIRRRRQWHPLQCSCLENPRDRGAWWAAQSMGSHSWTWLKRLSSSSSNSFRLESQPVLILISQILWHW